MAWPTSHDLPCRLLLPLLRCYTRFNFPCATGILCATLSACFLYLIATLHSRFGWRRFMLFGSDPERRALFDALLHFNTLLVVDALLLLASALMVPYELATSEVAPSVRPFGPWVTTGALIVSAGYIALLSWAAVREKACLTVCLLPIGLLASGWILLYAVSSFGKVGNRRTLPSTSASRFLPTSSSPPPPRLLLLAASSLPHPPLISPSYQLPASSPLPQKVQAFSQVGGAFYESIHRTGFDGHGYELTSSVVAFYQLTIATAAALLRLCTGGMSLQLARCVYGKGIQLFENPKSRIAHLPQRWQGLPLDVKSALQAILHGHILDLVFETDEVRAPAPLTHPATHPSCHPSLASTILTPYPIPCLPLSFPPLQHLNIGDITMSGLVGVPTSARSFVQYSEELQTLRWSWTVSRRAACRFKRQSTNALAFGHRV